MSSRSERTGMPRVIRMPGRDSSGPSWARACITFPSAVNLFSAQACSTWISAHCRGQYSQC
jgi:hypothetical protein